MGEKIIGELWSIASPVRGTASFPGDPSPTGAWTAGREGWVQPTTLSALPVPAGWFPLPGEGGSWDSGIPRGQFRAPGGAILSTDWLVQPWWMSHLILQLISWTNRSGKHGRLEKQINIFFFLIKWSAWQKYLNSFGFFRQMLCLAVSKYT